VGLAAVAAVKDPAVVAAVETAAAAVAVGNLLALDTVGTDRWPAQTAMFADRTATVGYTFHSLIREDAELADSYYFYGPGLEIAGTATIAAAVVAAVEDRAVVAVAAAAAVG
jgi:hypothetical protein